jgi:hypothetical protein
MMASAFLMATGMAIMAKSITTTAGTATITITATTIVTTANRTSMSLKWSDLDHNLNHRPAGMRNSLNATVPACQGIDRIVRHPQIETIYLTLTAAGFPPRNQNLQSWRRLRSVEG